MFSSSQASVSSSQFELIFNAALNKFKEKTGKNLLDDWLAKELQNCDSVDAVMDIIQGQVKAFDRFMNGGSKLMKWVRSSVHVLYTISAALGDGVGVAVPSAKAVFTGIGILLAAAKDVRASHDALVDLFERIQFFLKRLGVHTRISPTKDMVEILVKIMAEVIGILSIATKEMQRSKTEIYLRKLLGSTDIEDALKRLDSLTQEEVRMAIAQVLQGINELKDDTKKTNEAMQQIVEKVDQIQWNQIEQDVRTWLSSPDPTMNYNIARKIYQEGTAMWFLEGGIFKEWDLIGSLLWIHGKPGSGKSILCTSIIKHVISLCDAGPAALAYYYFDFRDEVKRNLRSFVTSLLAQLSDYSEHCRNIILRLYSTHGKGARQPDIDALTDCLKEMLKVIARQPVYIIVDALDECPDMSGMPTPRETVLSLVEDLTHLQLPFLHLCITSRPEADIKEVLEPLAHCVVSLHDENGQQKDILDYVKAVVSSDRKMRKWRDEEKNLVIEELSNKVDGMFRWAFCQLEVLRHCLPASIRPTLYQLPDTLDETYARVLSQIPQANQAHAHRLLQCLMVAVRPLRVEELAEVLAFEFDDTSLGAIPRYRAGWQLNDQEQAVLSTCSSLIAIVDDNDSQVVQFSHFSVKEFLMSDRLTSSLGNFSQYQINPGSAHTLLAQACLGVLHLDDHANEPSVKRSPLAKYAAQHWVTHAQFEDVASRVRDGMVSLFDCDKPHFAAWVGIYDIDHHYWTRQKLPTPLYYSSLCGFTDLVKHLATKHPLHVNAIDGRYKLPLLAALVGKHVLVAEILLTHGADVHIGMRERTRSHEPIVDVGIVKFLLKHGADANYRRGDLRTPLHQVVRDGELEVAQVLLEHKANVDSWDNEGKTPFHMFEEGDADLPDLLDLGKLLQKHGADVNIRDKDCDTPLHLVMARGSYDLAEILLKLGADASAENYAGKTPWCRLNEQVHRKLESIGVSVYESHILDVVRLSLEQDVDVNMRMQNKWALLHDAALNGWFGITEMLLDHGANVNAGTERGETPLLLVSRGRNSDYPPTNGDVRVARLLVERGADVNARDGHQNTPLHLAALGIRLEIAQILLDNDANAVVENDQSKTPLHLMLQSEINRHREDHFGMAQLLLEYGVDINALDEHQNTPLHLAAVGGMLEVAQVLLDHGANADAENDEGETPLGLLSRSKYISHGEDHIGTARLLLRHGVDVNAMKNLKSKTTPLHSAAFKGRLKIVRVLLDHGANPNTENDQGETPLNLVSRGEYDSKYDGANIARLLLERGVDVNAQKKSKNTPLHSAAFKGRLEIAQVLLDYGAIPDAENDEGETPLNLVSRHMSRYDWEKGDVDTVRLLLEHGVNVNARNKNQMTPLHSAASTGKLKTAQILLENGADADAENDEGETPLNLASRRYVDSLREDNVGSDIVQLLLEYGVDVDTRNKNKMTPLHSAALSGNLQIVQILLERGANADAENDEGETPLNLVSRQSFFNRQKDGVGIVRLLLERGVDVNARNKNQMTALHLAAFEGDLEMAQILLERGANADAENDEGETPLNLVSRRKYGIDSHCAGIARLLLERGVDVNTQNKNKTTPLHSAAFKGMSELTQVLLDYGANAGAENDEGETPLNLVSRCERDDWGRDPVSVVRLLLECGVDVHSRDKYRNTALHSAAFKGRPKIARLLLDYGANPNIESEHGETLLHEVSSIEDDSQGVGIARLLLQRGADVHAQDRDHNTALHSAAFAGRLRLAQLFLGHGANANAENEQRETPLHLVSRGKYDSQERGVGIARLLLKYGVDVNGQKRNKWTPLHLAAFKGRLEIVRALLDRGANPNAEDGQGETPLHIVSQGKYDSQDDGVGIARLLLERGADVNASDKSQYTPFDSASYFGRFDIARLLLEHSAKSAVSDTRGTKRKADDVGRRSEKKPKLHHDEDTDLNLAPWRHALSNLGA